MELKRLDLDNLKPTDGFVNYFVSFCPGYVRNVAGVHINSSCLVIIRAKVITNIDPEEISHKRADQLMRSTVWEIVQPIFGKKFINLYRDGEFDFKCFPGGVYLLTGNLPKSIAEKLIRDAFTETFTEVRPGEMKMPPETKVQPTLDDTYESIEENIKRAEETLRALKEKKKRFENEHILVKYFEYRPNDDCYIQSPSQTQGMIVDLKESLCIRKYSLNNSDYYANLLVKADGYSTVKELLEDYKKEVYRLVNIKKFQLDFVNEILGA